MGWGFGSSEEPGSVRVENGKGDAGAEISSYSRGQKILLEDTKPLFGGEMSQSEAARASEQSEFGQAWEAVKLDQFRFEKLAMMPCFRDAGMVGFSSMAVMGSVMFLYHKNVGRATNWAVGGLLLGSIVGWEQCRTRRRRSFQVAERARAAVAAKRQPMINEVAHDETLVRQWDRSPVESAKGKPWYRFW